MKLNIFLCWLNRALEMLKQAVLVSKLINNATRSSTRYACGASRRTVLKILEKYSKENWYMASIFDSSEIIIYNMAPRLATGWYALLAYSISLLLITLYYRLIFTSLLTLFETFKFSISSTSSKIFPFELFSSYNILSSFFWSVALPFEITAISSLFLSSISGS